MKPCPYTLLTFFLAEEIFYWCVCVCVLVCVFKGREDVKKGEKSQSKITNNYIQLHVYICTLPKYFRTQKTV